MEPRGDPKSTKNRSKSTSGPPGGPLGDPGAPKWCPRVPKWCPRVPKWCPRVPKWYPRVPKMVTYCCQSCQSFQSCQSCISCQSCRSPVNWWPEGPAAGGEALKYILCPYVGILTRIIYIHTHTSTYRHIQTDISMCLYV